MERAGIQTTSRRLEQAAEFNSTVDELAEA
jgi:hypothetical protein